MLKFKVKKDKSNTEKSLSDNQSESGNTDSTEEIDINVTTKLFMKKFKKKYGISQRQAQKIFSVKSVRSKNKSKKTENIQKYFLLEECSSINRWKMV